MNPTSTISDSVAPAIGDAGPSAIGDSIYAISRWGEGYFEVAANGHLAVRPDPQGATRIDLPLLTERLREQGLSLPVLVRFDDILRDRVRRLHQAFGSAIERHGYHGRYRPVYPIKVNQQHGVVRALLAAGGIGLEAGSKPELLAVLALTPDDETIVCNGYKDREYVRLALLGRRIGRRIFIVIEKPSELDLVLEEASRLAVEPLLGVRVRLAAAAAGNWQNSGGEKAKFGLSASQILTLLERLRAHDAMSWLRLLHAHLGSQIPNLRDIGEGVRELAQFYAELRAGGAALDTLDVGGGLGVDYEGTRTRAYCSVNYSPDQYAEVIVSAVAASCQARALPEPDLITEAGRALSAHHAVLITDVVDREQAPGRDCPASDPLDREHLSLAELAANLDAASREPPREVYERSQELRAQVQDSFARGELPLAARARAEELHAATSRALLPRLSHGNRRQRELLDALNAALADKVFCNFSLFQSLPDIWAIDQIFPILPLQRLDEAPTARAILQDLTCDSDGCIGHYVDQDGIEASLPLHDFDPKQDRYLIGFFMVGAYQEILGDIHNLFGDTDAVNIELDPNAPDGYRLGDLERGDSTEELLRYVHFEPRALLSRYRQLLQQANLDTATREAFYLELKVGLYGYTYLGSL
ncbi:MULTISPECIES: biosynthetic arginine decarboxylase [Thiorhodovibrio]|uniref:biosynthetic arginine decarboxylase n=1 Tax=Thiorhodovibrio TaxID=61593 RepID=UPI001913926C|nr:MULTISPECIES: biosynthetic arginine decarboxylase [Thiorhodovibrio]MBK5968082.1 arginine decarboxylase [Thiorhodovibrio winogradskyi]WPL10384.1 Biosynthetic arginine decarboxylase [Thiorhodovibrio litoralis]